MPGDLRIELLGGFAVVVDGDRVAERAWRLRKARSLVKLLALAPRHTLHREQIFELLWPDRDPASASANLRQTLHVARRAIGGPGHDAAAGLASEGDLITLSAGRLHIDLLEFEQAAAAALAAPTVPALRDATARYAGELLPEDRFEAWTATRRAAAREQYLLLVVELARRLEHDGDAAGAIATLQLAVAGDPLHEPAQRDLMRLYAATGRRQRALAQYQALRETLRLELADEPEAQTRALYRTILTRDDEREPELAPGEAPAAALRRAPRGERHHGNLPVALTSLVGRERQIEDVTALLAQARLLTLTGTGGTGKTRLALEVAGVCAAHHPDGVWLAELAPLSEGEAVAAALAAAVGADTSGPRPVEDALVAEIGERRMLVVLDNCEHVVDGCAALAQRLLSRCGGLTILATSRELLRAPGEVEWRVPALALAGAGDAPDVAARAGAVALFCERARAAAPAFALSDDNVAAVIDICRRVEGIPLALELAAARTAVLSAAEIADRLRGSLAVLSAGPRTADPRQRTLTGMLDWSHELLDETERRLFARMAVFAGSCTIDGVEDVCGGEPLPRDGVLDVVGQLVAKSLVVVDEGAGASRVRLLAPIRWYAAQRLAASGEEDTVRARHRRHYLALAQDSRRALLAGDPAGPALARAALDEDDLRSALRGALEAEPQLALELVDAQWRSWFAAGRLMEADGWVAAALDAAPRPSALRARVLLAGSILAGRQGRPPIAFANAEAALAVAEEIGDADLVTESLLHVAVLGWAYSSLNPLAEQRLARAGELAQARPESALGTAVLGVAAAVAWSRGRLDEADRLFGLSAAGLARLAPDTPCFVPVALGLVLEHRTDSPPRLHNEDTLTPWRRVRADRAVAYMLVNRASVARWRGDLDAAAATLEEALARSRDLRDAGATSLVLLHLGATLRERGELDVARELMQESLAIRERRGDASGVGLTRNALALLHARAGDHAMALELLERSRTEFTAAGDAVGATATLADIGYVAIDAGDLGHARQTLERALAVATDVFHWLTGAAWLALALAGEARAAGDGERERAMIERARGYFAANADVLGAAACDDAAARAGTSTT